MATSKKINPHAEAPELIRKIKSDLKWTQQHLEAHLRISQQSVSNYALGKVFKERYDVLKKLQNILAKKLRPPDVESKHKEAERDAIGIVRTDERSKKHE